MNIRGSIDRIRAVSVGLAFLAVSAFPSSAAVVGQWNGSTSGKTWDSSGMFSNIYNAAVGAGNTIHGPSNLTTALNGATHLIIAEPTVGMSASDLAALSNWLGQGGILMLFVDSNPDTTVAGNQILAGINYQTNTTNIQYDNNTAIGSTFVTQTGSLGNKLGSSIPGRFAVNGSTDLSGAVLNTTTGWNVTGGFSLADNSTLASFIRTDRIGLGTIFVFGDRLDHSAQLGSGQCSMSTSVQACQNNLAFYMNILGGGNLSAPEPNSVLLSALGLLSLGFLARRRRAVR